VGCSEIWYIRKCAICSRRMNNRKISLTAISIERKRFTTMAKAHNKALLRKALLGFLMIDDLVQAVLEWVANQMILIEVENKNGAEKGKHKKERKTHFSGVRVRSIDTRLGTIQLYISKLRKGVYAPFFVTESKRSEMTLAKLVQEACINGVSTWRIHRPAQALGVKNIWASQVSEFNKEL